eukprot:gene12072-13730_t
MPPKQRRGTFTLPAKRAGGGPSAASTRSAPSGLPKAGGTGVNRKGTYKVPKRKTKSAAGTPTSAGAGAGGVLKKKTTSDGKGKGPKAFPSKVADNAWEGCYRVEPVEKGTCVVAAEASTEVVCMLLTDYDYNPVLQGGECSFDCPLKTRHLHCTMEGCNFKLRSIDYRSMMRHLNTKHEPPGKEDEEEEEPPELVRPVIESPVMNDDDNGGESDANAHAGGAGGAVGMSQTYKKKKKKGTGKGKGKDKLERSGKALLAADGAISKEGAAAISDGTITKVSKSKSSLSAESAVSDGDKDESKAKKKKAKTVQEKVPSGSNLPAPKGAKAQAAAASSSSPSSPSLSPKENGEDDGDGYVDITDQVEAERTQVEEMMHALAGEMASERAKDENVSSADERNEDEFTTMVNTIANARDAEIRKKEKKKKNKMRRSVEMIETPDDATLRKKKKKQKQKQKTGKGNTNGGSDSSASSTDYESVDDSDDSNADTNIDGNDASATSTKTKPHILPDIVSSKAKEREAKLKGQLATSVSKTSQRFASDGQQMVRLDVGGEIFHAPIEKLLAVEGSLFEAELIKHEPSKLAGKTLQIVRG